MSLLIFSAERISLIPTLASLEAILFSESDSPKEQDGESTPAPALSHSKPVSLPEHDSLKLNEQSTPRPPPSSTFEPVSPPEYNSIELDEESTPRIADFNNFGSVSSSESDSMGQPALCEPVPSSESNSGDISEELASQADDLTPSLKPIPSTNCDLPVEQDATSEESLVVADSNKSITLLSAITGLNPSKSARASQPNTVKTPSMREDESANFIKQLDNFAVFFGVEKPSKITSMPPLEVQAKLGCSSESDTSSLPAANDSSHNDDTPSSPTCGHLEMVESYKRQMGYLDQIQASLEKSLARANDENSKLLGEREMLTEEFNQLQWNFDAERTKNAKLERTLHTMKSDHIKILTRQDWEMNQLKRFNAAMVDLKLHAPVLFNAAHSVCNGQPADAALIAAIKEAATKFGSPWAEILPAVVGDRPDEIYHHAMQRCKLESDRRAATKKYLFWKMKAQMDTRHAKYVTPSSSSMSLVLDSCLPKETLKLNGVNDLLAKLKTGKVPRRSQPPASSPAIAGSSRFEGAHVASDKPNEDVPSKAPVASSPVLISEEPSEDMAYETPVALSPIHFSEEPSQDELYEVPVASSLMLIPQDPSEDASSESVTLSQIEPSPVIIRSQTFSGPSSFTCEAPARVIRHYVPGRVLFGEDGSGLAPPGLFDRDEREDRPELPALSHGSSPHPGLAKSVSVRNHVVDHIEHASVSRFILSYHHCF